MRHRKHGSQFNRFSSWRKATLRSLVKSLFVYQSIKTTKTKARAAKSLADSLISLAKQNTLAAKREVYSILHEHQLVSLLFDEIAPRFPSSNGGYTRLLTLGKRRGDNAEMALLELTEIKRKEKKPTKKEKKAELQDKTATAAPEGIKEKPAEEKKTATEAVVKEKPPSKQAPSKKFLGGLRGIFKKERDSL